MSAVHDIPTFDGDNGVTCEAFIRAIRRYSLIEGKEKDDQWIALTAATCLDGSASQWYEGLDDETQDSWKVLRRAILLRWPTPAAVFQAQSVPETQAHIPTPAAAPPVPAPSPPSPNIPQIPSPQVSTTGSPGYGSLRTGRIRVISETASFGQPSTFIASKLNPRGCYETTGLVANALVVRFNPSKGPHEIFLQSAQVTRIGVFWLFEGGRGNEKIVEDRFLKRDPTNLAAALTSMTPARFGWQLGTRADYQGIPRTAAWSVMINGAMVPFWQTPAGALYPAEIAVAHHPGHNDDGVIQLSNSFQRLGSEPRVRNQGYSFEPVGLVFEEI